jgi:hypothetical protein
MTRSLRNLALAAALLAVAGFAGPAKSQVMVPAPPQAIPGGWFGYTNDTQIRLVVQVSSIINNVERRGQPRTINPRERALDPQQAGVKIVTIMDPQLQVVGKFQINFLGRDAFYSIQVDPVASQIDKTLRLRLVPAGAMPFPR